MGCGCGCGGVRGAADGAVPGHCLLGLGVRAPAAQQFHSWCWCDILNTAQLTDYDPRVAQEINMEEHNQVF